MPFDAKITIHGLREAMDAVGITDAQMRGAAGKAAALATIAEAKPYPGQSGKKQPFKSAKSRRYFFAALKSGAITVPYRRTFALQDAWEWQSTGSGADVTNAHPHADYTIAPQNAYHKGNWPSEAVLAQRASGPARDAAEMAIIELVAKA